MPGTWRYAEAARRVADEVRDSFESDPGAYEALERTIATMTVSEWRAWHIEAADEIAAFASATPCARRRRRWKRDALLLHLAAFQFCMRAAELLHAVDLLGPGGSYRDTLREAGMAAESLEDNLTDILFCGFDGDPLWFRDVVPPEFLSALRDD